MIFQCYEFFQNYDYIKNFNDKYSSYEYVASPSINYVDRSYFDPNDFETNVRRKWRCIINKNLWYGASSQGMVLNNGIYGSWNRREDCMSFIFETLFLNFDNPCKIDPNNNYCNIFKQSGLYN